MHRSSRTPSWFSASPEPGRVNWTPSWLFCTTRHTRPKIVCEVIQPGLHQLDCWDVGDPLTPGLTFTPSLTSLSRLEVFFTEPAITRAAFDHQVLITVVMASRCRTLRGNKRWRSSLHEDFLLSRGCHANYGMRVAYAARQSGAVSQHTIAKRVPGRMAIPRTWENLHLVRITVEPLRTLSLV